MQTVAGTQDIHCDDFDETDENEYWFIFHRKPPLIFLKANVISIQEQAAPDPRLRAWFEAKSKEMQKMRENHRLRYDI